MTYNPAEKRGPGGKWIKGSAILNIGLHVGDPKNGGYKMSEADVRDALGRHGAAVTGFEVQTSDTEPTAVVSLKRGFSPEHLGRLSIGLKQDAIAQRREDGSGDLEGPKAADWGGKFNPEYFLMPKGTPTPAPVAHKASSGFLTQKEMDEMVAKNKAYKAKQRADRSKGRFIEPDLSFITPAVHGHGDVELSNENGRLAFWKQILPMKTINYTAKDGSRQTINFDKQYLTDLANNMAVDKVGFLLADAENRHTMDPERWRGNVVKMEVRDDGLYGKIVFPNAKAAAAVLDNPELGVSARIREGVQRSDGSTVNRGIIHVLGTLDPQVSGMSPWQTADLSNDEGTVLDLSNEEYKDMADKPKALADYTDEEIEAMSEEDLNTFLAEFVPDFDNYTEDETSEEEVEDHEDENEKVLAGAGADMAHKVQADIELANQAAAQANARATEALKRAADAEWRNTRESYLGEGVPPHLLDLAAPVLNRPSEMVIDLSNEDSDDINVSAVVKGLLDACKGMVDLSNEQGHNGFTKDGEDPDAELLARWTF